MFKVGIYRNQDANLDLYVIWRKIYEANFTNLMLKYKEFTQIFILKSSLINFSFHKKNPDLES